MSTRFTTFAIFCYVLVSVQGFTCLAAGAELHDRFEIGAGIIVSSAQSSFELGAEYEHRMEELFGVGATGNVIFSNPALTLIAVPNFFLHPLGNGFLVSAAPLVQFTSVGGTSFGSRFGTRIPIPLGNAVLIPEAAIDFIAGGPITVIGLGIGF